VTAISLELGKLREQMRASAQSAAEDKAVGEIAAAEEDALAANGPGVLRHLKNAGTWAFDVATKIGASVAAEALEKSLGL